MDSNLKYNGMVVSKIKSVYSYHRIKAELRKFPRVVVVLLCGNIHMASKKRPWMFGHENLRKA